jgi:hypothetical protein
VREGSQPPFPKKPFTYSRKNRFTNILTELSHTAEGTANSLTSDIYFYTIIFQFSLLLKSLSPVPIVFTFSIQFIFLLSSKLQICLYPNLTFLVHDPSD